MFEKEKGLFDAFVAKKISRRELINGAGKLGLSASAAGMFLTQSQTRAMAADFDWMKYKGTKLKLLLNKHPYADAMIANIQAFKDMTGMDISWDIFPEDVYFDKVTAALSSGSTEYDAFMTGAYMTWTYGPAGWITDLNEYIKDPAKTNPNYNWEDVLPGLRASTSWNGVPGGELGSADAKQWCIPWGFELNNISYNKKMFDKVGVQPPKNIGEMIEVSAKLTKDLVDEAHSTGSLRPLRHLLFGFESLVRARPHAIDALFQGAGLAHMEPRYLRPDVLFALSHNAKVGLELDQACLHQAVINSKQLPGALLLNILPRNLYNIGKLLHLFGDRESLMFEVSETEAINNFDIMLKVRENLDKMHMRIATDDFGRGHSGLEQIIKLKPDLIKLDRSLIQDLHKDKAKQDFVGGLVRAARISCATILAEGVESWGEAELLQEMGIDLVQGFLLHRPQAAALIEVDLEQEHSVDIGAVA